jgi:5-formyltetrahydrofolate cyclo-ligase
VFRLNLEDEITRLKKQLRIEYKEVLRNLPEKRRSIAKNALLDVLRPKIDRYKSVLSFVNFKLEIDMSFVNEYLVKEKKLHLAEIREDEIFFSKEIELILLPGLAFDSNFTRLGRGRGHYDKFLSKHKNAHKIGICFKEQISGIALPRESHDVGVDEICAL